LAFEPVQGGVERALLHLQRFFGDLLDALGDRPTVFGLERNRLENQQIQRALDEIGWFSHRQQHRDGRHSIIRIVDSQGMD
jgi:hypothetical protein